ncbi:MAG: acyl-ACP--UDP-N-acetylglucosamine O-acyltransferase [Planctomycetota bacterium]|nr:acyl-ACP--UDP-N-acetylglucosamine O-acyltransferase [Planctomycetota bacterium]
MATTISDHAVVDPRAELGTDVEIGPFCMVGPDVTIGSGTRLLNNVTLTGHVTLGEHNELYPGVVIGAAPQDLSYQGGDTRVEIGDHNIFREGVTVNRASEKEEGRTTVGNHCYFMACSHIAHDCRVGNWVIMANATLLGGHVHVHDRATLSGGAAVHHFASIGSYSFVSGLSRVLHDVPPYMLVDGVPARPRCINIVALKRNDFTSDDIRALSEAHRVLYRAKVGLDHAREILRANGNLVPAVNHLLSYVQTQQEGRHGRGRERRRAA